MTEEEHPQGRLSGDLEDAVRRGDIQYLVDALGDASFETRIAAADRLGEVGGDKANLALLTVARDRWGERPEVRIAALRSLGGIHGAGRYSDILQQFIAGDNRKVMAAARKMLQAVDPDGYPRRLAASGAVDHGAMRVYGISRERSALPLLREYVDARASARDIASSGNWGKVYAAARALGKIGGAESVEILERLLSAVDAEESEETKTLTRGRLDKIRGTALEALERAAGL